MREAGKLIKALYVSTSYYRDNFPDKYSPIRLVEFKDLARGLFAKAPEERDVSFLKEVGYESKLLTDSNMGAMKTKYSAGYWYLDLYMPLGTL